MRYHTVLYCSARIVRKLVRSNKMALSQSGELRLKKKSAISKLIRTLVCVLVSKICKCSHVRWVGCAFDGQTSF